MEPNKYTLDVKELDRRISYAASNPRVDPTVTALKNAQGQTVDADGDVDNGSYYKQITNQTRDSKYNSTIYQQWNIIVRWKRDILI